MVRLLLLRHFKSAWDEDGLADHDRPLSPRGRCDAALMAAEMADHGLFAGRILCSTARRTRETLAALLPHIRGEAAIRLTDRLYQQISADYLGVIADLGAGARSLMVIGHNPAIQATALHLVGAGNPELVAEIAARFPTGALAVLDFDAEDWRAVTPGSGRIVAFTRPAESRDGKDEDRADAAP